MDKSLDCNEMFIMSRCMQARISLQQKNNLLKENAVCEHVFVLLVVIMELVIQHGSYFVRCGHRGSHVCVCGSEL